MGFLNDLLNGKEKTYKADPLAADINEAGKSGLLMLKSGADSLNKIYSNPDSYINNQIDVENNMIRSASNDALQKTRDLINRRGMGTSSIGIGEEIGQQRATDEKTALNKASGLQRLKGLYDEQMQVGNRLYNIKAQQGPVQMQDIKTRQGGLAPLIGAGLGGFIGGPQGAQMGAGLGQLYANS